MAKNRLKGMWEVEGMKIPQYIHWNIAASFHFTYISFFLPPFYNSRSKTLLTPENFQCRFIPAFHLLLLA